ncbi:MAG: DUF3047 domain-containing protein [Blastocatellia bacterium]|nr:DUF3047 domain-containing protein [Blastocatellia bacterium]MBL8195572.1 DUF3047 domain-containing protein [Blastocatellia bacterium]MBN8724087.1 DUF3047 domain-containing protein [Acidobacteriota bacterium]
MLRILISLIAIIFILQLDNLFAQTKENKVVASFANVQQNGLPTGWDHKELKGKNNYSVVEDDGMKVLKADSKSAASGLFKQLDIDPKQYQLVSWQWKITNLAAKADESKKDGDDCVARTFVIFQDPLPRASAYSKLKHKLATSFSSFVPTGVAICYVWGNKLAKNQDVNSPYTDWVRVVAVESGKEKLGQWVNVERNVFEDFKRIYGVEPKKIVAVAVMTDTDQTKEPVITYYKDIVFKSVP